MINSLLSEFGGRELLKQRLCWNLNWLEKSFKKNNDNGSSAYRTLLGYWSESYPETTGYLIPTLLNASKILDENKWENIATKQIPFFKTLQHPSGSYPTSITNPNPNVFDNSQILLGLCSYNNEFKDEDSLIQIKSCYDWLISQLNDEGRFDNYNLSDNYNPSYYTRILWALLQAENLLSLNTNPKTLAQLHFLQNLFTPSIQILNASFYPNQSAYSHTIAYAIRGLLESYCLLNHSPDLSRIILMTSFLHSHILKHRGLAGSYDEQWNGNFNFICCSGNIQLAIILLKLTLRYKEINYIESIKMLISPILKNQNRGLFNHGAIAASIPIYGDYQRFKFTNWTQKFFVDFILLLLSINTSEAV